MGRCLDKLKTTILLSSLILVFLSECTVNQRMNSGTCLGVYIVSLSRTSNGTLLEIITGPLQTPKNITMEIPYTLPQECMVNPYLCGLQHTETDTELNVYLPGNHGFVQATYHFVNDTVSYAYFPVQTDCSTVQFFHNTKNNRLLCDCLRFTGNTGRFSLVEADLSDLSKPFRYSQNPDELSDASTLSPSVYVEDADRIFCVESNELLSVSAKVSDVSLSPQLEFSLTGCTRVNQIEGIADQVYLYCENNLSWIVKAGTREQEKHSNYTYPCTETENVVIQSGVLYFNGSSLPLPFTTPVYGMCLNWDFFAQGPDGSLHRIDLTTKNLSIVTIATCLEGHSCLRPILSKAREVAAFYDSKLNTVNVMNLTGTCGGGLVNLSSPPSILYIATSARTTTDCPCPDEPATVTTTDVMTTIAAVMDTIGIAFGITVPLFIIIALALVIISILVKCGYIRKPTSNMVLAESQSDPEGEAQMVGGKNAEYFSDHQLIDTVFANQEDNEYKRIVDQINSQ